MKTTLASIRKYVIMPGRLVTPPSQRTLGRTHFIHRHPDGHLVALCQNLEKDTWPYYGNFVTNKDEILNLSVDCAHCLKRKDKIFAEYNISSEVLV